MNKTVIMLLFGAAFCCSSPAVADHLRRDVVVVVPPGGFKVAPIPFKVRDKRWPYVSWIGLRDSIYAPGPLVTFVRGGSY